MRIILPALFFAIVSLLLLCFSAFGFLAAFELTTPLARLPWQAAYAGLALLSIVGVWRNLQTAFRAMS